QFLNQAFQHARKQSTSGFQLFRAIMHIYSFFKESVSSLMPRSTRTGVFSRVLLKLELEFFSYSMNQGRTKTRKYSQNKLYERSRIRKKKKIHLSDLK
ncbi:hypothetical protein Pfo_008907, partial [Paulownia fortunei]